MKHKLLFQTLFLLIFLFLSPSSPLLAQRDYSKLVNPFIGTGGHGHTFPGAVVPFGMVQVSPDTRIDGSWDGCSGYHYDDPKIYGFSHTHLSGTGCSDFGDIMLMPVKSNEPLLKPENYSSTFDKKTEKAEAGYYAVVLKDGIKVELTSSARAGFQQYTFEEEGTYQVVLDLFHRDKLLDGKLDMVGPNAAAGFRRSEAWAKDQYTFFYVEFSKPFQSFQKFKSPTAYAQVEGVGNFTFTVSKGEKLQVKVGISLVDERGAKQNLLAEIPHWDFSKTIQDAKKLWNAELAKIEVKGGTPQQDTIFYTALYHCFIHPSLANDVDGRYRGRDNKIYTDKTFNYYSVFSLWDTFRALHPLFNLVQRDRNQDFIKTFVAQYQQVGRMPMWELGSNETDCMIGYHSVSVIADALAKDNGVYDAKSLLEAVKGTAENHPYGAQLFASKGYLSVEDESESVSKTLEYAYNHWCVEKIFQFYEYEYPMPANIQPNNWQHVFNPRNGFMQPRNNGGWYQPFDPKEVNNNYTEANAWQYTFFVPHDVNGLIAAMGGADAFEKKLTELFETSSQTTGRNQADITGLIGQYAHGNEPSHHMAYLYNFIGKPHLTQQKTNHILTTLYHNAPDGLSGNEDCGQMSAWYVFSAMGFYPVTPGKNEYELGSGLFKEVIITSNKQITKLVFDNRNSAQDIYASIDAKLPAEKNLSILTQYANAKESKMVELHLTASSEPKQLKSFEYVNSFTPHSSPIIEARSKSFKDSMEVSIRPNFDGSQTDIYYHIFNEFGDEIYQGVYTKPFFIKQTCMIDASINQQGKELHAKANFVFVPHQWKVKLLSTYYNQYTAGGAEGLIDGLLGDKDWRKGGWQGYYGNDFEAVIDLGKSTEVKEVFAHFLQDQRAWIMYPKQVLVYGSKDGKNFTLLDSLQTQVKDNFDGALVQTETLKLKQAAKVKYIKIKALNYGKLPAWHLSAGENAYIFVDEIGVK